MLHIGIDAHSCDLLFVIARLIALNHVRIATARTDRVLTSTPQSLCSFPSTPPYRRQLNFPVQFAAASLSLTTALSHGLEQWSRRVSQ